MKKWSLQHFGINAVIYESKTKSIQMDSLDCYLIFSNQALVKNYEIQI